MPILDSEQIKLKADFESFLVEYIIPNAKQFDEQQSIPRSFFKLLAEHNYLGASIAKQWGGLGYNYVELGLMHESFAKGLASLENIITVSGMVAKALSKFASVAQRNFWLPKIVSGEVLVSLALTEPEAGSDLKEIKTFAQDKESHFLLNGTKKYITLGKIADVFLVLAKSENGFATFLVKKEISGIGIKPINDLLSLRSNMLAEITFTNCEIPREQLIGKDGYGLSHIVTTSLDEGRYTTACACVGLAQACLDVSRHYANNRKQSGVAIDNHQLILKLLTEIIVNVKSAREVCFNTARLRDNNDITYISETLIAKYLAAKVVANVANQALQIFGGVGLTKEYPIERFYRDAKAMEIIEGTPQIYEINIPKNYL